MANKDTGEAGPAHPWDALARTVSLSDSVRLLAAIQALSASTDLEAVQAAVRAHARELVGADGISFVLRDGDRCFYADEDAITPLWKGQRFPMDRCVSGMCMRTRQPIAIRDIYADPRVPHDAYRPTFVRSLALVPVRVEAPVAALGAYWADLHVTTPRELALLESLASAVSVALTNAELLARSHAAEAELRRTAESLQRALRSRDDFLTVAAHELRTPLTTLQLHLGAMRSSEASEGRLERAIAQTRRLGRLVEDLLSARALAKGVEVAGVPVELADLTRTVLASFEAAAAVSVTPLVTSLDPATVLGDRTRLEQVVTNLVSNALKYGAGRPVSVAVRPEAGHAVLEVRDQGIGIASADQARIFEPFERAVSVRHYGGFGLGFAIARDLVRAHDGTLEVVSEPGRGATFTVRLPLLESA